MTTATHALRPRAAPPETRRTHEVGAVRAIGSPRYLSASLKLGGVHDPEEREAEHAAGVVAAGGCYKVKDPGGSDHLGAEADPKHVRPAAAPRVVDPGAEGRVRRAVAPPVVDPGAAGRVRRAMAERVHDPGGSASLRALHAGQAVRGAASAMPPVKHDVVDSGAASRIEHARAGVARPMPQTVRARLEHGFSESRENVRLHTGPAAHAAAAGIHARAYTEGERITLGQGESEHDVRLLAHEAMHVVQNRRAAAVPRREPAHETRRETTTTARREVGAESTSAPMASGPIRRLGLSTFLNALADLANNIPGSRLFTIILGVNPINMEPVARSGANILRGAVEIIPGGGLIVKALDSYGIFEKAGAWVEQQLASLAMSGRAIRDALMDFLDSIGWRDLLHPGDVWDRAKRIFTEPIDRMIAFFKSLAEGIIAIIKEAVLRPLAALAAKTRAWDLLIAVLGRNPITGDPVPQTAETLIGGLMKLIGQEDIWENMKKANAINRAFAWFKGAMAALLGFIGEIPTLFINALKSLKIEDLLDLPGAFMRIAGMFGDFVGHFISWAGHAVWNLLEIIFDVVSPGALAYVKKTGAALKSILKNPIPFVRNLVRAAKLGLENFKEHFVDHLKAGLIDWLTGSLPGVYIPKALSLVELGKFALSVLGITWAQIRGKIVKALGAAGEKIMATLEKTFDVIVALVQGGPAALWELIKEKLTDLKDTVIDGIIGFVRDSIVTKAIPKLVSMFIPGAGFISAIISIYDTIMVFVHKLARIAAVVMAFVDSIVAIAAGQVAGAARRVESALAGLISLAISFLAGFLGLGDIASKILGVIEKVRAVVDKALDTAINWIVGKAKGLFAKLFGKKDKDEKEEADPNKQKKIDAGITMLRAEESKRVKNGQLAFADAKAIASAVKAQNTVFQSFEAFEAETQIKYRYTASPPIVIEGPAELPRQDVDLSGVEVPETTPGSKYWDITIFANITDTKGKRRQSWVLISVPMDAELKRPTQPPTPSMVIVGDVEIDGKKRKLRLDKGLITEYALKVLIERYAKRGYGDLSEIHGSLAEDNKALYQIAFANLRISGVGLMDAKDRAVLATPFGKYRAKLGYDKFTVTISGFTKAVIPKLDPKKEEQFNVPTSIDVIARR